MKRSITKPASRYRVLQYLALILFAAANGGCTSIRQDRFVVNPSALDYLQIVRSFVPEGSDTPITIRLDLAGSGHLQRTAGRSERVRNRFWQEAQNADWEDWRQDYVVLSPADTLAFFQAFVNAGFFDRPLHKKHDENPDLAILIAIRKRKNLLLTSDPVYHQVFADLLRRF